jgi:hypothetical protein
MEPVTTPLSSPLTVRQRRQRVWAEDASKQVVLDGRIQEYWPERYVAATSTGTQRVSALVETAPVPYLPVLDAAGREVARIVTPRRQDWVLQLPTGESMPVHKRGGGMITPPTCAIGDWSSAVAPRLAPQRYFTLTIADAVLARADRDALVAALAWISESTIAGLITDAGGGAD